MQALHSARRGENSLAGPNRRSGRLGSDRSGRATFHRPVARAPSGCAVRPVQHHRSVVAPSRGASSAVPSGQPAHSRQRRFFFVCLRCPSRVTTANRSELCLMPRYPGCRELEHPAPVTHVHGVTLHRGHGSSLLWDSTQQTIENSLQHAEQPPRSIPRRGCAWENHW